MDTLDFLERVDLFKGMGDDRIEAIQSCCETGEFKRGERIFRPGEDARFLYILMEGLVELRKEAQNQDNAQNAEVISRVSAGDVFGWSALVEPHRFTAGAMCLEKTSILVIDGPKIYELCQGDSHFCAVVMANLAYLISTRLRHARQQISIQSQRWE